MPKVPVSGGAELDYELLGAGDKRIALIHSLALDREVWRPVAERLSPRASVLLLDCRGHGRSSKPAGDYSVELFADDVAALLDAIGWQSAVVAGASMGGNVSIAFAAKYPDRLAGLGLVDTTAWYGADAPQSWNQRAEQALEKGLDSLIDFQLRRWFSDGFREANPELMQSLSRTFTGNDLQCYAASCRMLGAFDLRDGATGIKAPTAIAVGSEDYATTPAMAEDLHQRIKGSTIEVLDGAKHLTPLECPDRIAALLGALL